MHSRPKEEFFCLPLWPNWLYFSPSLTYNLLEGIKQNKSAGRWTLTSHLRLVPRYEYAQFGVKRPVGLLNASAQKEVDQLFKVCIGVLDPFATGYVSYCYAIGQWSSVENSDYTSNINWNLYPWIPTVPVFIKAGKMQFSVVQISAGK